jgi:RNA polymerase sigma-70 factor (ECF subfamily)
MDQVHATVDKLYKEHFGRLVAGLLYSSRDIDPETAEDIVHDSFSAALTDWAKQGIPVNAMGWIYRVCRHKALNRIKKDKRTEGLAENTPAESVEIRFSESLLDDQSLKLLFACAHPDLAPKIQVAITLKYAASLKVEAIARSLGMTLDGVDKLLLRARQKIKDEKILLEEPHTAALKERLPSVHKVLYLIFNEGYRASWGKELLREELCEEALLMTRALQSSALGNQETTALYALMLFNSARFKSRFGTSGELLDLESQDRSHWNKDLILLASNFLHRSQSDTLSSYHLEAAIACLHCTAPSFRETDWEMITNLYRRLLENNPNPFVELNYAIALYYNGEKENAFSILERLQRHPFLGQYVLLNVTLGKFHHLEGNDAQARHWLTLAYGDTTLPQEKEFIKKMMDGLSDS